MAMADFLKDLPTQNADNFTKINPDTCHRSDNGPLGCTYISTVFLQVFYWQEDSLCACEGYSCRPSDCYGEDKYFTQVKITAV